MAEAPRKGKLPRARYLPENARRGKDSALLRYSLGNEYTKAGDAERRSSAKRRVRNTQRRGSRSGARY